MRRLIDERGLHGHDGRRHGRGHGAADLREINSYFFFTAEVAAFGPETRFAFAGRLLSQVRSVAPAALRLAFRAGRFCAISCWVRPERMLVAWSSTSQPGTAAASRFLMSSQSLPLPRPFMCTSANSPDNFSPCSRNF